MSDRQTHYPPTEENAVLLLAAAQELGVDKTVVRTSQDGLTAPDEVLDKAFGKAKGKKAEPKSTTESKE